MIHDRDPARRRIGLATLALALLGLSCAKAPRVHYYDLRTPSESRRVEATSAADVAGIGIAAFSVDPPYDGDRIVYRVGEQSPEVGFYAYHRWAAPLSRMLPSIAADKLRGTKGLAAIGPLTRGREYGATLHGRVLVLEEIDSTHGQIVRLRLELTLERANGTVAWSAELHEDGQTNTDAVGDIVEAMAAAVERALSRAGAGLAEAARTIAAEVASSDS